MTKKHLLHIILLTLMGGLALLAPAAESQPVSAQTDETYYFPIFTHNWNLMYSTSYYMITIDPEFSYDLGCEIGTRDANASGAQDSVVVLDFSYPVCNTDGSFGAELFGFGPVPLSEIQTAAQNLALGYYQCSVSDTESNLVIGVGTNNRPMSCETSQEITDHGTAWAGMVNQVNQWAIGQGIFGQVQAYGANDIEIGWNTPTLSRDWIAGYEEVNDYPLIHFGDAAGCPYEDNPDWMCGGAWTQEDVWYVSWGASASLPLPLIYLTNGVHAQQWASLSQYGVENHGSRMDFTGVFTQSQACEQWGCSGTDNTPEQAYRQLYDELNKSPETAQELNWSTDIRWILREEAYPDLYPSGGKAASPGELTLQQTIDALRAELASPGLSADAQQNLIEKWAMLESIAANIHLAKANPAPKSGRSAPETTLSGEPDFQTGIRAGGAIAGLPYGAQLANIWQDQVNGDYLQVGAGSAPGIPSQGAVYILVTSRDKAASTAQMVLAKEGSGMLSIIEVTEASLVLQSESGLTYHFDLGSWSLTIAPY